MCITFQKKSGETPLQALDRLRLQKPELAYEKLSYVGRLDPLAEGEMLILVGDECKNRAKYMHLDKTYEVDILFGVSTDTGDVLGKVTGSADASPQAISPDGFVGKRKQSFPKYSSKNIKKVLKNETHEESSKEIEIYSIKKLSSSTITAGDLENRIVKKINEVTGDFRQKEILEKWHDFFKNNIEREFGVLKIVVHCSSGTYMRVLAEEIGAASGMPALALHINRTHIDL